MPPALRRQSTGLPRPASFERSSSERSSSKSIGLKARRTTIELAPQQDLGTSVKENDKSQESLRRSRSEEEATHPERRSPRGLVRGSTMLDAGPMPTMEAEHSSSVEVSEGASVPRKFAAASGVNKRASFSDNSSIDRTQTESPARVRTGILRKVKSAPLKRGSLDSSFSFRKTSVQGSVSLSLSEALRRGSTISIPDWPDAIKEAEEEPRPSKDRVSSKERSISEEMRDRRLSDDNMDEGGGDSPPMDKKTLLERTLEILERTPQDRSKKDVDILCEITKESEFFQRHGSLARPLLEAAVLERYEKGDLVIGGNEEAISPMCLLLRGQVSVLLRRAPEDSGTAEPEPEAQPAKAEADAPVTDKFGVYSKKMGGNGIKRTVGRESHFMNIFDTLDTLRLKSLVQGWKTRQRKTERRVSTTAWNQLAVVDDKLQFISELSAGSSFGEQSLILGLPPQGMVVVCEESCLVLVVRPGTFDAAEVESLVRESSMKLMFMGKSIPGAQWLIDQANWRLRIERGTRLLDFPAGHVFTTQGELPQVTATPVGERDPRRTMFTLATSQAAKDPTTLEKAAKSESSTEAMLLCQGECSLSYLPPRDSTAKARSGEVLTNVMSGHIIRGASVVADCAEPFTVVSKTAVTVLAISQKLLQRLPKKLMTGLRQIVLQQLQWISSRAQEKLPIDDIWTALQDQGTPANKAKSSCTAINVRVGEAVADDLSVFAQSVFLRRKGAVATCPLVEGLQATFQDVPQKELRTIVHTEESQKQLSTMRSYWAQSQVSSGRCDNWQKYASRGLRRTALRTSASTDTVCGVPVVRREQQTFGKCTMQSMHGTVGPTPANAEKPSEEKASIKVRPSSAGAVMHSANGSKTSSPAIEVESQQTPEMFLEFQRSKSRRPMSAVEKAKRAEFLTSLMEGNPSIDSANEGALGQMIEMQEMSRVWKTIRQRIDTGRKLQQSRPSSAFSGRKI